MGNTTMSLERMTTGQQIWQEILGFLERGIQFVSQRDGQKAGCKKKIAASLEFKKKKTNWECL